MGRGGLPSDSVAWFTEEYRDRCAQICEQKDRKKMVFLKETVKMLGLVDDNGIFVPLSSVTPFLVGMSIWSET